MKKVIKWPRRAAYGKHILATRSRELTAESGAGFNRAEFDRMTRFAQSFPEEAIVVTRSRQLSWSHVFEKAAARRLRDAIGVQVA